MKKNMIHDENVDKVLDNVELPTAFDPFRQYLAEIHRHPVLTKDEENEVTRLIFEKNDATAVERLILANLRLVVKISLDYYNMYLNILDLIQEGNVGLLHAIRKYNPYKGTKFSTYASFWIKAYILKHILDSWSLVKVGTTQGQRKLFYRLNKEKRRLEASGVCPTTKLLASSFGLKEREVEEMETRLSCTDISLESPLHDREGDTIMDTLASDDDIEEVIGEKQRSMVLSEKLSQFKATLDDRDLYILNHRLLAEEPMSLQDIGNTYSISRERVRQVERKILKNFKNHFQRSLADLDMEPERMSA